MIPNESATKCHSNVPAINSFVAKTIFTIGIIAVISFIPIGDSNLQDVIYAKGFTSWLEPKNASFLFAISYMLLIWVIGYAMDKKKIYIKV